MKAPIYEGPGKISWRDAPEPGFQSDTDAIVRVSKTAICGTDLHILKGDTEVSTRRTLGHEAVGAVEQMGTGVKSVALGDRVLVSCTSACGICRYCSEGHFGQCLRGGGWILSRLIDGTKVAFVRVPFADTATHPMPTGVSDEEILILADIVPIEFEVGVLNGLVQPGDTIAIVGAGPVGLSAITGAKLFSPSNIISIDLVNSRLDAAKRFGADRTFNSTHEDPVAFVKNLTNGLGVDVAIEAVGASTTFELCTELVRPGGRIANINVHAVPAVLRKEIRWTRDVTIATGLVDTHSTPTQLRLLKSRQTDAASFVTRHFNLDDTSRRETYSHVRPTRVRSRSC